MADYTGYGMPKADFSILGDLGNIYDKGKVTGGRERALSELGKGASLSETATALFKAGDIQGGMGLANLANTIAQQEWNKQYQGGMLDVSRQNANTQSRVADKDQPLITEVGAPGGLKQKVIVNPSRPGTPFPIGEPIGEQNKLTAADHKAIYDAEDHLPKIEDTREALLRAKELNPKAFTGYGAQLRGDIGTNSPIPGNEWGFFNPERSKATSELGKIMSGESIQQMSATLKGATTDKEMKEFQRIMADPNTTVEIRGRIIDRMLMLADRQKAQAMERLNQLRGGTYFKPGGGASSPPPAAPGSTKDQGRASPPVPAGFPPPPRADISAPNWIKAVQMLRADPRMSEQFDEALGEPGAAARVLGVGR